MPDGGSAYTSGGKLPCKYVIHTVGPIYHNYNDSKDAHAALQSALVSTLEMAKYLKCESVSIPAISSGIFGFPKDKCADIMIENSLKWVNREPGTVKNIRFCNFDAPTVKEFYKALARLL